MTCSIPGMCSRDPGCADHHCPGHPGSLSAADMQAGMRMLHVEDGGTWCTSGHRVLRLHHHAVPTGWPPGLLQDEPHCSPAKGNRARSLSKWLATTPDAKLHAREAAAAIRSDRAESRPTESATARSDALGWIVLVIAVAAALAVVLAQLPF